MRLPIDQRSAMELVRDIADGLHGNVLRPGLENLDKEVVKVLAEGFAFRFSKESIRSRCGEEICESAGPAST